MNKLDKKQIPQFAALCVLSAGAFGYFVVKIVTPSPAAAGTRPHPAAEVLQTASASSASAKPAGAVKAVAVPDAAPSGDEAEAPAPTPGMRDPFVVGYVDPKTLPAVPAALAPKPAGTPVSAKAPMPVKAGVPQVATIREIAPASPAVPFGLKGFPALGAAPALSAASKKAAAPEAPAAPAWTVTGVLQGASGEMAVLRSGEARRIVRNGDFVDSTYRVVTVTRNAVVLRHGTALYHLTLGAAKSAPTAPALTAPALPALTPASPAPAAAPAPVGPQEDALAPAAPPAGLAAGLAQVFQGAVLMARSYMTPAQTQTETCFALSSAPMQEASQAALDLNRDVYAGGPAAEGGAPWRCALAANLDAAPQAGTLPDRFI